MVQYIVKEVNQFPSDIECMRYIATIADKVSNLSPTYISSFNWCNWLRQLQKYNDMLLLQELLKKCHQCMETIVKAKDQQAAEANKNASILLKELDMEKVIFILYNCS